MLQSDLDNATRLARGVVAVFGLLDGPDYGRFAERVLAGGDRVQKVASVAMKRRSDDHCINVFQVQEPSMVGESLHAGCQALCLFVAPLVDIGSCDKLDTRKFQRVAQIFLTPSSTTNH